MSSGRTTVSEVPLGNSMGWTIGPMGTSMIGPMIGPGTSALADIPPPVAASPRLSSAFTPSANVSGDASAPSNGGEMACSAGRALSDTRPPSRLSSNGGAHAAPPTRSALPACAIHTASSAKRAARWTSPPPSSSPA